MCKIYKLEVECNWNICRNFIIKNYLDVMLEKSLRCKVQLHEFLKRFNGKDCKMIPKEKILVDNTQNINCHWEKIDLKE